MERGRRRRIQKAAESREDERQDERPEEEQNRRGEGPVPAVDRADQAGNRPEERHAGDEERHDEREDGGGEAVGAETDLDAGHDRAEKFADLCPDG